jgi:hypothetical protein
MSSKIFESTRSSSGWKSSFSQRSLSMREVGRIIPSCLYCWKNCCCSLSAFLRKESVAATHQALS